MTKQIIELHKGNIKVESKLGEGATFSFSLPVSNKESVNKSANQTAQINKLVDPNPTLVAFDKAQIDTDQVVCRRRTPSHKRAKAKENLLGNQAYKILVVDDDAINRQVLLNQ